MSDDPKLTHVDESGTPRMVDVTAKAHTVRIAVAEGHIRMSPEALDAIESGRHMCNAMVLDTSCICPLPYDQLSRLCARSPVIQSRLMNRLSRKIVDHEALLLILGQKTAEQRMAAFLLHFSRQQHDLGLSAVDINLPMSRADIASYLALAVETVSRVLTRLQDGGLLDVQRNHVRILNLDKLATIAEETLEDRPRQARATRRLH